MLSVQTIIRYSVMRSTISNRWSTLRLKKQVRSYFSLTLLSTSLLCVPYLFVLIYRCCVMSDERFISLINIGLYSFTHVCVYCSRMHLMNFLLLLFRTIRNTAKQEHCSIKHEKRSRFLLKIDTITVLSAFIHLSFSMCRTRCLSCSYASYFWQTK